MLYAYANAEWNSNVLTLTPPPPYRTCGPTRSRSALARFWSVGAAGLECLELTHIYIYIYVCIYMYICIYIYIGQTLHSPPPLHRTVWVCQVLTFPV